MNPCITINITVGPDGAVVSGAGAGTLQIGAAPAPPAAVEISAAESSAATVPPPPPEDAAAAAGIAAGPPPPEMGEQASGARVSDVTGVSPGPPDLQAFGPAAAALGAVAPPPDFEAEGALGAAPPELD